MLYIKVTILIGLINEIWPIPVTGLLALLTTFITSRGTLIDKRFKLWYKKINLRGWIVFVLSLLIVCIGIAQFLIVDHNNKIRKDQDVIEQHNRDSTLQSRITEGVDSNRKKLFGDLSIALSKQSLKLDTVRKELTALQDSGSKVPTVAGPLPVVMIDENGIVEERVGDTVTSHIKVRSFNAGCILVSLRCNTAIVNGDGRVEAKRKLNVIGPEKIAIGGYLAYDVMDVYPQSTATQYYYFYIRIQSLDRSYSDTLEKVYFVNEKGKTRWMNNGAREDVISTLHLR